MKANGSTHDIMLPKARPNVLTNSVEKVSASTEHLPAPAREAVRALFQHGKQHNLSLGGLADLIHYDRSTVSKLFNGHYSADSYDELTTAITSALSSSSSSSSSIIARTSVVDQIEEIALLAWLKRRIVFVFGPTQAGKTAAIKHFARAHPHHPRRRSQDSGLGTVKIVNTPANGGARGVLNNLAIAYHVSPQSSWEDLKLRTFNQVSENDLIIVDEFSQCFDPVSGTVKVRTVRLVREIWNQCQCGMVIVMTDIAKDEMQKSKFVKICDELYFRSAAELELDRIPCDADLKLICAAHGYPAPDRAQLNVIRDLVQTRGLTRLATLLELGADVAADRAAGKATKPSWSDFASSHDTVANFATRPSTK